MFHSSRRQSDHCFSCKTKFKFECFSKCFYWEYVSYPAKGMIFFFLFAIGVLVGTFLNTVKEEEQSIEGCYCLSGMIFCYCACPIDQNFPWSTLSVFYSYFSGWTCRNEVELVQKHHPGDMEVHCSSLLL